MNNRWIRNGDVPAGARCAGNLTHDQLRASAYDKLIVGNQPNVVPNETCGIRARELRATRERVVVRIHHKRNPKYDGAVLFGAESLGVVPDDHADILVGSRIGWIATEPNERRRNRVTIGPNRHVCKCGRLPRDDDVSSRHISEKPTGLKHIACTITASHERHGGLSNHRRFHLKARVNTIAFGVRRDGRKNLHALIGGIAPRHPLRRERVLCVPLHTIVQYQLLAE